MKYKVKRERSRLVKGDGEVDAKIRKIDDDDDDDDSVENLMWKANGKKVIDRNTRPRQQGNKA